MAMPFLPWIAWPALVPALRRGLHLPGIRARAIGLSFVLSLPFGIYFPASGQVPANVQVEITLHDANPRFSGGQYLAGWAHRELATVQAPREGTAADGVSRLLVRVEVPGPGTVEVELTSPRPGNGSVRMISDPDALRVEDRFLAFALYTPPEEFGPSSGRDGSWHDEVDFRGVGIRASFTDPDGRVTEGLSAIVITRPPLVLVHGTFDNPVAAWRTQSEVGPAPADAFSAAGFRPFTVDYSGSNAAPAETRTEEGGRITQSWLNPGESSFRANRQVVLDNPQGIRHALAYFRDTLGIAAAQADVVGHSLGGILGRVLASEEYNPDYRTAENFNQGWINRLVTVSTPHHGSDLPDAMRFFQEARWMEHRSWTEWFIAWSIPLAAWWEGRSASAANAVRDQLPQSEALGAIGPTRVPSHAIVGTMDISRLRDDTPTELLFTGLASVFYYFPGILADYFDFLVREWESHPPEYRMTTTAEGTAPPFPVTSRYAYEDYLRGTVREAMDVESEFWLSRRDEDWLMTVGGITDRPQLPPGFLETGFDGDESEYGILDEIADGARATYELGVALQDPLELRDQAVPFPLVDLFRDLIFRNDANDGTVRLQSQTGSLDPAYVTRIETPVVHSISPRYPEVQRAVIEVLEAGGERFSTQGFPEAGQQLPAWLPSRRLETHYPQGEEAICWSGMVWDHAEAFAAVADSAQAIVMVRPVNPDATALIARNVATKGMAVKGKSSNWGPQVGFIAENQRFSKLWRNLTGNRRAAAILKYDSAVVKVVDSGQAELRELRLTFDDQPGVAYTVYEDPAVDDAEEAIHLVLREGDDLRACGWRTGGVEFSRSTGPSDCRAVDSVDGWRPLRVLADPGELDTAGNPRYLTADYDLLAIGFREPPLPVPYLLHAFLPNHFPNDRGEMRVPGMHRPRRDGTADTLRFDDREGFITREQSVLVGALNQKVAETGYVAGRVTHHGPENHYSGSPYVDYPITVFEPSRDGPGRILSIPMGPAGFRDIHLKRYLLRKRQEGYDLVPNPEADGWQWDAWGQYSALTGWDSRDAQGLPPYAAELPFPASCRPIRQLPDEVIPEEEVSEEPPPPPLAPLVELRVEASGAEAAPSSAPSEGRTPPNEGAPLADYLIYDDLVLYFQPARDTTETVWDWRVVRVDQPGDTALVTAGSWIPGDSSLTTTERASPGSPAAFVRRLGRLWREDGPGPGSYLLQSCLPAPVGGVFGSTYDYAGCRRPWVNQDTGEEERYPWQDEGSFEVGAARLVLKDLIAEEGAVTFGGENGPWLALENVRSGSQGGADLFYTWDECVNESLPDVDRFPPCAQHGEGWKTVRHTERTALSLDLPRELDLQAPIMGELTAALTPVQEITAEPILTLDDLVPGLGPNRNLVTAISTDATALVYPPGLEDERPNPEDRGFVSADGRANAYQFLNDWRTAPGDPERPMVEWIRGGDSHWFLPIQVRMGSRDLLLYAIYGIRPGPYTGARPAAPDAVAPPPPGPAQEDPEVDQPGVGDPATGGGGGPTTPVDPGTLDPDAPDVSGLIGEWIGVAKPPDAWPEDPDYHYDEWGRRVGVRVAGVIQATAPPDDRGANTPQAYVWGMRDLLDSVDHCTLGDFVVRALEDRGIEDCRGRYAPPPLLVDYQGQVAAMARSELEALGYAVEFRISEGATSAADALTVVRQSPEAGKRQDPDEPVTLFIRGTFEEVTTVPDLSEMPAREARDTLEGLGLVGEVRIRDPADSQLQAHTVARQNPGPGAQVQPGSSVTLFVRGDYVLLVRVPDVVGRGAEDAGTALRGSGLTVMVERIGPPLSEEEADRVVEQAPRGGAQVRPETTVRLRAFDAPDPSRIRNESCNRLVGEGMRAHSAGNFSRAVEIYDEARARGCNHPALTGATTEAREGVVAVEAQRQREEADRRRQEEEAERRRQDEERQRQERERQDQERRQQQQQQQQQQQRCNDYYARGDVAMQNGRLQEALGIYRSAQGEGCTSNPPLGPFIADLEQRIAQENQRGNQCTALTRQARQAHDAANYDEATNLVVQAGNLGCNSAELSDIFNRANQCAGALGMLEMARRTGTDQTVARILMNSNNCREAGGGGGPPVDVNVAQAGNFVGTYDYVNPAHPDQIFGWISLRADGTFVGEDHQGPSRSWGTTGRWAWDPQRRHLDLDWDPGGRFQGPVTGNTFNFRLSGHFSDGSAGALDLRRRAP